MKYINTDKVVSLAQGVPKKATKVYKKSANK